MVEHLSCLLQFVKARCAQQGMLRLRCAVLHNQAHAVSCPQNESNPVSVVGDYASLTRHRVLPGLPKGQDDLQFGLLASAPPGYDQLIPIEPAASNGYVSNFPPSTLPLSPLPYPNRMQQSLFIISFPVTVTSNPTSHSDACSRSQAN